MRHKDEHKQHAIIEATVKLVNEIGFASASVSKIAREAGVSPATLYVYYENKEDLLVSTYVEIKKKFAAEVMRGHDPTLPIRDRLKHFWNNAFVFIKKEPGLFQFSEQFAKTPYANLVDSAAVEKHFSPIFDTLRDGIAQKIIKDISLEILAVFMFYPVLQLANPRICIDFKDDPVNIDLAFNLAWDAIRL
jgi:AcrR family transcriptional regulator